MSTTSSTQSTSQGPAGDSTPFNLSDYLVDVHVANGRGERVALVVEGRRTTYRELSERVASAAAGLRALGVGAGDRVLFVLGGHRTPRAFHFVESLPRSDDGELERAEVRRLADELTGT